MDSADANTATSTIESQAARIRPLLRQQKFPEALAAAQALLAEVPNHRDVLLCAAIAQRYLGRISDAMGTLATLEQHHARFSRLYEERGLCFVALKQAPQAIDAFLRAVNINHALPTSWRMLDGLYRMTGEAKNAAMAASHVATLQKLPAEVVSATSLFEDGDLDAAEPMIRAYLLQ
ncbi:MAG: tetratricopeptide repeat protein, partial [Steroidobacteraceae bacterium]